MFSTRVRRIIAVVLGVLAAAAVVWGVLVYPSGVSTTAHGPVSVSATPQGG